METKKKQGMMWRMWRSLFAGKKAQRKSRRSMFMIVEMVVLLVLIVAASVGIWKGIGILLRDKAEIINNTIVGDINKAAENTTTAEANNDAQIREASAQAAIIANDDGLEADRTELRKTGE